jgi:hypothetical protein
VCPSFRHRADTSLIIPTVHAAVALSTLLDNPSVAEDAVFGCIGIYNARERLRSPYSERLQYTGCATVGSLIAVPAYVAQNVEDSRTRLLAVAKAFKPEYMRQRTFPAVLGNVATVVETIVPAMKISSYASSFSTQG